MSEPLSAGLLEIIAIQKWRSLGSVRSMRFIILRPDGTLYKGTGCVMNARSWAFSQKGVAVRVYAPAKEGAEPTAILLVDDRK